MVYCIECLLAILVIISIYNLWSKPFKIWSFKGKRHRLVESFILNLDCYLHCVRIPFVCSWSSIWIFLKVKPNIDIFLCFARSVDLFWIQTVTCIVGKIRLLAHDLIDFLSFIILYFNKKILESYKTRLVSEVSSPIASC